MNDAIIYASLILAGLCFGSFAGASMWRLRAWHLKGENIKNTESKSLNKLTKTGILSDRSKCLDCSYTLCWYDMIPIISWVALRGKCRKCHKPIGYLEPLIEISMALFFVMSYVFWPYSLDGGVQFARFIIWLMSGVGMAILFAYDQKWYILPDVVNFSVIGLGILNAIMTLVMSDNRWSCLVSIIGALLMLGGLYLALYKLSRGRWVGFGDVKLGFGLALLLADWRLAFVALFAANLIGCLVVIPFMMAGRLNRKSHVPFGPLLIIGTVIANLFGGQLVNLYLSMFL